MARIFSIIDETAGVTASMRVDESTGTPLITDLAFKAQPGAGVTVDALHMLQQFGLELPVAGGPSAVARELGDVSPSTVSNWASAARKRLHARS